MTFKLVLLRHGESAWNKENRFCSWVDQKLTENGIKEAQTCGKVLKEAGFKFDLVLTSILSRSIQTAWHVLHEMEQEWVQIESSWRLNERHYGALIGLNRAELAAIHGEEKVRLWRRSYDVTPPPIDESHPSYHEIYNDRRYNFCDVPKDKLPKTESLKEVLDRLLPYWNEVIAPEVKKGKCILISAHGNSARALLKHLEANHSSPVASWARRFWGLVLMQRLMNATGFQSWGPQTLVNVKAPWHKGIPDDEIVNLTLPTGVPVLLELDECLHPVKHHELLGDQQAIQAAIKKVEDQGKAKAPTN
ncbi:bisphosphoglycerate mutase isoform X1 [Mobula birostris]|uniref:bisphosphoglycerate mutase isoform X1 n=1 Tax=Mobula birostris TaxID=1983395 RepID=UPI003B2845B4